MEMPRGSSLTSHLVVVVVVPVSSIRCTPPSSAPSEMYRRWPVNACCCRTLRSATTPRERRRLRCEGRLCRVRASRRRRWRRSTLMSAVSWSTFVELHLLQQDVLIFVRLFVCLCVCVYVLMCLYLFGGEETGRNCWEERKLIKAVNGLLPLRLNNLFITNSDIHYHRTRQHYNLHIVRDTTSIRASSIQQFRVKILNLLDTVFKTAPLLYLKVSINPSLLVIQIFYIILFINCHKRYHLLHVLYYIFVLSSAQYYFVILGPTKQATSFLRLNLYSVNIVKRLYTLILISSAWFFILCNRLHVLFCT